MPRVKKANESAINAAETLVKNEGGENITQTENTATAPQNKATGADETLLLEAENHKAVSAPEAVKIFSEAVQQSEQLVPPVVTMDDLEGLDMEAFASCEEPAGPHGWRIADDGCADWAVCKIAEERAELERIKELAEAQIQRIEEKVAAAERRCENGTRFLTAKLAEYFELVPHKKTKTKESYRLLSGTLTKKLGGVSMKQDDEKLLEYLKSTGNDDMIKTTEKPMWGEYKKKLQIVAGQVVDTSTGEIVQGVEVVEKPDTFSVDV